MHSNALGAHVCGPRSPTILDPCRRRKLDEAVGDGIAGSRYPEAAMAHLDSERTSDA
jgi:hypothetical protein